MIYDASEVTLTSKDKFEVYLHTFQDKYILRLLDCFTTTKNESNKKQGAHSLLIHSIYKF